MPRPQARRAVLVRGTACDLAGLLQWAPPAVFGGLLWDLGIGCGYVAIVLMVLLYT